jgi:AraC-like DNA-binding protein
MGREKIPFIYRQLHSAGTLRKLARVTGHFSFGRDIYNSSEVLLRCVQVQPGLHIYAWNLQAVRPVDIVKSTRPSREYQLFYIISPKIFPSKNLLSSYDDTNHRGRNLLFVTGQSRFAFSIAPGDRLKAIQIVFSEKWLMNAGCSDDRSLKWLNEMRGRGAITEFGNYGFEEYRKLSCLHEQVLSADIGGLRLTAEVCSLLGRYFEKPLPESAGAEISSIAYFHRLKKVEEILNASLSSHLPPIAQVARKVALSHSTLKRQFRKLYGKNLYEYYLDLKMKKAREILSQSAYSVTEIASLLGYEKVSRFIDMFKKHYGKSPGAFRKADPLRVMSGVQ